MISRSAHRPAGVRISVYLTILLYLLDITSAWALPFFSSSTYNEQEEIDGWLASPARVTRRDLHPSPPKSKPSTKDIKEKVLILTPLKDAATHLRHHFALMSNLTYPHHLIDLGFIVGDSTDDTNRALVTEIEKLSLDEKSANFNSCIIVHQDLGDIRSQDVASRHGFQAQVKRRKKLAIVRNTLLKETLTKEHDWVYWRDVDVAESPASILEDFIAHGKDVVTPNIWFKRQQKSGVLEGGCKTPSSPPPPYITKTSRKNQTTTTPGKKPPKARPSKKNSTRKSSSSKVSPPPSSPSPLPPQLTPLNQGYAQFKTHRIHMAQLGDWRNSPSLEIPLHGVGGVSLLVRAELHRKGPFPIPFPFPPYPFPLSDFPINEPDTGAYNIGIDFPHKPVDHQIETEGLAKLANLAGYSVVGLPNYIVWHFDTAEKEGNLHETPGWLVPLLVVGVGGVVGLVGWRYRRWVGVRLRRMDGGRGGKVRRY
ncbi:MAG: hypothetical protein Q9195_007782 [Heterodermia aff. obscurata]